MKSRLIIIILLVVLISVTLIWWLALPGKKVRVIIPQGASAQEVANILKKEQLVSSRKLFLALTKAFGKTKELKAGKYSISPRSSIFSVIKIISRGLTDQVKVTIPEGLTSREIADILGSLKITDPGRFLQIVHERKLEGYLFPQTYFFDENIPAEKVVDAMVKEFSNNYSDEFKQRAKELKMSQKQILTLASIIEKEAVMPEERALISGVFHNRLKKRWYLESCATVLYAIGKHKERLTYKDLRIASPYNTYRNYGLPPGPICNPGIESIKAALYPQSTADMFFVVQGSGTHSFSRYLYEHIEKKNLNKKKNGKK